MTVITEIRMQNLPDYAAGDRIVLGEYTATCVKRSEGLAVFWLDQYLDREYNYGDAVERMPGDCRNDPNFRELLDAGGQTGVQFYLPSVEDIFGRDDFYREGYKYEDGEQWELMKIVRYRLPLQELGPDRKFAATWLYNEVAFGLGDDVHASLSYAGGPSYTTNETALPVRPVILLDIQE